MKVRFFSGTPNALMAKLVDALASGASEEIHESSSLSKSTIFIYKEVKDD